MKTITKNQIEIVEQKLRLFNNLKALPWTVFTKENEISFFKTLTDLVEAEFENSTHTELENTQLTAILTKIQNLTSNN